MNGEGQSVVKKRKVRSDKKRDVKPTIAVELKDCIYRLSYITNTPVKDVAEVICEKGIKSRKVIDYLSSFFRRDYNYMSTVSTVYIGDPSLESLQGKYQSGKNERITIRFSQVTYDEIKCLAAALDVTPSKATALLLDASVRNTNLLNAYVKLYLNENVDKRRMKELKQVLQYVNKNNPYNDDISWFTLLSFLLEEVKESTADVKEAIHTWMEKYK
ncbi:hypothetical protein [Pontibacillus litoralis]|uniref:Uncharacterized protein n=1 Tax=Pontibacillus litoralis JSM 072002 TaxID=1385512 RepID=A0A0A5G249_9BACI|nr:hypothetical protein [Pontibacillus litoralis]KGX85218.1 hypothetical protein N784_09990 [Pontibacillus litoralis JSM 072002]